MLFYDKKANGIRQKGFRWFYEKNERIQTHIYFFINLFTIGVIFWHDEFCRIL